jgi:hypothetical protein
MSETLPDPSEAIPTGDDSAAFVHLWDTDVVDDHRVDFVNALRTARRPDPHEDRTGTVANKSDVTLITHHRMSREAAAGLATELITARDPRIANPFGPAGAIPVLTSSANRTSDKAWIFFGRTFDAAWQGSEYYDIITPAITCPDPDAVVAPEHLPTCLTYLSSDGLTIADSTVWDIGVVDDHERDFASAVAYQRERRGFDTSVADKDGVLLITHRRMNLHAAWQLAHELMRDGDPRVADPTGPAGAIPIHGKQKSGRPANAWLFFGWFPHKRGHLAPFG